MNRRVTTEAAKHFAQLVNNNGQAFSNLLTLLKQEKIALEQRDYKAHQVILEKKQKELPKISKIDKEFEVLLSQVGLEFNHKAIDDFLTQTPPSLRQELHQRWLKMIKLLKECQRLNNVNEKIVFHTKQSTDRLMSLVKGEAIQSRTYSATGKANMYSANNQCLARA